MKKNLTRGEIWPLPDGGTADEIVKIAQQLQMDFCFFDHLPGAPGKAHALGMSAGAVVNGPWQRWMLESGWEAAMLQLGRDSATVGEGLARAMAKTETEVTAWIAAGVDMIVLADDICYAGGPYMSPQQLEKNFLPLYRKLCGTVRQAGVFMGFYTDGCVDLILPVLQQAGFQFYSLEPEGTDPLRAWNVLDSAIPLFSGLPAAWLTPGGFLPMREGRLLRKWISSGPLIVTSACGLYHVDAQNALREIYQWIDNEKLFVSNSKYSRILCEKGKYLL